MLLVPQVRELGWCPQPQALPISSQEAPERQRRRRSEPWGPRRANRNAALADGGCAVHGLLSAPGFELVGLSPSLFWLFSLFAAAAIKGGRPSLRIQYCGLLVLVLILTRAACPQSNKAKGCLVRCYESLAQLNGIEKRGLRGGRLA